MLVPDMILYPVSEPELADRTLTPGAAMCTCVEGRRGGRARGQALARPVEQEAGGKQHTARQGRQGLSRTIKLSSRTVMEPPTLVGDQLEKEARLSSGRVAATATMLGRP